MKPITWTVGPEDAGERIDAVAARRIDAVASRSAARKACKTGRLTLEGGAVESARRVAEGECIGFIPRISPILAYHGPTVQLLHADPWVVVAHKPGGVATNGWGGRTVEMAVAAMDLPPVAEPALDRPRAVHRLDARTQGLLVLARTPEALVSLGRQFEGRTVDKRYLAIVVGRYDGPEVIREPLDGRSAETRIEVLGHTRSLRTEWISTLALVPVTGRTHQLRRHVASVGHPVLGDVRYTTDGPVLRRSGLYLASTRLGFEHPASGERICIEQPEPAKHRSFRERESRRWARWREEGATRPSDASAAGL